MKQCQELDLSFNSIEKVLYLYFSIFTERILQIDDGSLDKLPRLKTLNLENNKKLELENNTFGTCGFIVLKTLKLGRCNLKSLPDGLLDKMP